MPGAGRHAGRGRRSPPGAPGVSCPAFAGARWWWCSVLEVSLGGFAAGDTGGPLLGVPGAAGLLVRGRAVLGAFETLWALPAPSVGGHGLVLEVARPLVGVGFAGDRGAKQPRRHGRGSAIKAQRKIGRPLGWAVSRQSGRNAGTGRMALGAQRCIGCGPVVGWTLTLATGARHGVAWAWRAVRSWQGRSGQKWCRREWMAPFSTGPFSWGWATLQARGGLCQGRKNAKKCAVKRPQGPCRSRTAVRRLSWTRSWGGPGKNGPPAGGRGAGAPAVAQGCTPDTADGYDRQSRPNSSVYAGGRQKPGRRNGPSRSGMARPGRMRNV